jgi:hypothetical protein
MFNWHPLVRARAVPAAALISVGEHDVKPLFCEKEPLKRLSSGWRKPERLRAARVHHDSERLEAEGQQVSGGGH